MADHRLGVIMHGVTGRMGTNQHLIRSVLAIRAQGGVTLADGSRVQLDPILVGRNAAKVEALAKAHGVERWTTDLDAALADERDELFFDSADTLGRHALVTRAIDAGKHVYVEKPSADSLEKALELHRRAEKAGIRHGVVQDKLFLPGLLKLRLLRDAGFFGRILSVKIDFGYWVFEGDLQPTQRPSWNYKKSEGGGVILDMLPHFRYVLDNLFGAVRTVGCVGRTFIPERRDEQDRPYPADADDAAFAVLGLDGGAVAQIMASWCTRVRKDDLVTFHVDGTHGSAVAGLTECWTQGRVNTPRPVWNPDEKRSHDFFADWQPVPDYRSFDNGFKAQWEMFVRHLFGEGDWKHDLLEGAKGVQLAELGLRSWAEKRFLDVPDLATERRSRAAT